MIRLTLAVSIVGLGLVAGCGDDSTGGGIDVTTGPIQLGRLLTEARNAECDYLVRCTFLPSPNDCGIASALDPELIQLVRDTENGIVAYDETHGRTWVDAVRNRPCHSTQAAQKAVDDAWAAVFTGSAAVGAPCLVDGQCAGDATCDLSACMPNAACCAGACIANAVTPVGGDCSMGEQCEPDSACLADEDTGMLTCTALAGTTDLCSAELPCGDGLRCDTETGSCFKLSAPGEACNPMLSEPCIDFTTYCDTASETCASKSVAGQPCGGEAATPCVLYGVCNDMGFCEALPIPGAPCGGNGDCLVDQFCQEGECYPAVDAVACGPIAY